MKTKVVQAPGRVSTPLARLNPATLAECRRVTEQAGRDFTFPHEVEEKAGNVCSTETELHMQRMLDHAARVAEARNKGRRK